MPRTLVNFVTVLNVAELEDLHEGLVCQGMQTYVLFTGILFIFYLMTLISRFLCDCAINTETREIVRAAALEYQAKTTQLIDSGIYDTSDDFTVVRQPFMEHMTVPVTVN